MIAHIEAESTLTDRYQTSVPTAVRQALKLGKRDKIRYVIRDSGEVVLQRVSPGDDDPALAAFLLLLERDIQAHPERLQAVNPSLISRTNTLVKDVDLDLDAPLDAQYE